MGDNLSPHNISRRCVACLQFVLREKFTQNEDLKTQLLDTAQLKLGETGRDQVFSIGLSLTNPEVLNINKWKRNGNKLGIALEKIRNELRNDM